MRFPKSFRMRTKIKKKQIFNERIYISFFFLETENKSALHFLVEISIYIYIFFLV